MDEAAYRQKFGEEVGLPCVFERTILAHCVSCEHSAAVQIAEREALSCRDAASRLRCAGLHAQLRRSFAFALGKPHDGQPLPHAQEMRVQCGGLLGLQQVLNNSTEVGHVAGLLDHALQRWGGLEAFPWSEVVHAAAQCYKGRHG